MMHLTCTNVSKDDLLKTIEEAKSLGIRNLLALRGDPPMGHEWETADNGFEHAIDLVKLLREKYGDYFCIAVAGSFSSFSSLFSSFLLLFEKYHLL